MKKYTVVRNYAKLHHKQAGMTLIELTVVLLILIGLAGLLIPYVGSFVQKTHDSTNSSNLAQLNSAFGRFVATENKLPHHMDTLVNDLSGGAVSGTGACATNPTTAGAVYCGLLDRGVFTAVAYPVALAAVTTTPADISYNSLANAKIQMAVNNKTTAPNKTFGSYTDMIMIDNTGSMMATPFAGVKVGAMRDATGAIPATVTDTDIANHLAAALGKDPMDYKPACYDYVVFGLGDANGLVTKTIASAPVNYPEDATKGPVDYYNHYMAIVQVDKSNTAAGCSSITEAAKFLGVVMNVPAASGSHLVGVNSSLASTYENQLAGK